MRTARGSQRRSRRPVRRDQHRAARACSTVSASVGFETCAFGSTSAACSGRYCKLIVMSHCYYCGREITTGKSIAAVVVESHTGRLGTVHLHCGRCDQSLVRYRQTITWAGSTVSNLMAFKRLHGRVAAINKASSGSVPVLVARSCHHLPDRTGSAKAHT